SVQDRRDVAWPGCWQAFVGALLPARATLVTAKKGKRHGKGNKRHSQPNPPAAPCGGACPGGQVWQGRARGCPSGFKDCQGTCIPTDQCCAGTCPQNLVCCTNVNECKDVRNDKDFCGGCTNHQCPGGAFCANGRCGLSCTTVGDPTPCFAPDC